MNPSINLLATVKSPLLPLVVLFVCTAQVLTLADQHGSNKAHLETIAQFHKEIVDCNTIFRSIIRKDGKDVVDKDPARCTKRVLCVAVTAYRSANSRDWADSLTTRYRKMKDLLQKFALIPPLTIDEHDILKMDNEFRKEKCPRDCQFYKYYKSIRDEEVEKKIKDCADSKKVDKQVSLLANYFVPLARKIISDYDGAISYITRQYEAHCIDLQGIVHQYPKYYFLLWCSMFKLDQAGRVKYWKEYIATACPVVPFKINGPDPQPEDMKDEVRIKVEVKEVFKVPENVAVLWEHFELLRGLNNMDALKVVVITSYEKFYLNKPEKERRITNENVWIGYQMKLLVQQTVLKVMDYHFDRATKLLDDKKGELQDFLLARTSSNGQIPELLTTGVHQVLSTSDLYQKSTTKQRNDILALVLKLAYGQENVYLKPNSVEQPLPEGFKSGLKRNVQIDKVRIFFPQIPKELIYLPRMTDSLVRLLLKFEIISFDEFFDLPKNYQNMMMVRLVFALEDIMNLDVQKADEPLLPKPVEKPEKPSESEKVPIDPHPSQEEEPCYKSTCFRGTIAAIIVSGALYGIYWKFFSQSNDTLPDDYSPPSNSSITDTSTQSPSGIHFWLMIVTMGAIFALLSISALFYLIRRCRYRKRGNRSILTAIGILILTGASLVAYYFLGNLNSKVTLVLCVGAFLLTIFVVGWVARLSESNGEQQSIKPSKKASSNLAAASSCLTSDSSSGLGGSSTILSSSVASSAASSAASSKVQSTANVPAQSSSSVIGTTNSFGPTSVNQCLTKSMLKLPVKGPVLKKSPVKGLKITSPPARTKSPARKSPTSAFPSVQSSAESGVSTAGSNARNSSYFTLTSAVTPSTLSSATNVPVAKKTTINSPTRKNSDRKGPSNAASLASRVKSPTGKVPQSPTGKDAATTKPGEGDPKGVHKKKK